MDPVEAWDRQVEVVSLVVVAVDSVLQAVAASQVVAGRPVVVLDLRVAAALPAAGAEEVAHHENRSANRHPAIALTS